jgi:hypothetical protein
MAQAIEEIGNSLMSRLIFHLVNPNPQTNLSIQGNHRGLLAKGMLWY